MNKRASLKNIGELTGYLFAISWIITKFVFMVIHSNQKAFLEYNDMFLMRQLTNITWGVVALFGNESINFWPFFLKLFVVVSFHVFMFWVIICWMLVNIRGVKSPQIYREAAMSLSPFLLLVPFLWYVPLYDQNGLTRNILSHSIHIPFLMHLFFYMALGFFLLKVFKLLRVDYHKPEESDHHLYILLFIYAMSIFILLSNNVNSDGLQFYGYLRSMVLDGNLNVFNERMYFDPFHHFMPISITKTGYNSLGGGYIGASLLGVPFFVIGHLVALGVRWCGLPIECNGYSFPYRVCVSIGYSALGFMGYLLTYRYACRYFQRKIALYAVLGIMFTTTSYFYMYVDFAFSHTCSMFFTSAYLFLSLTNFGRKKFKDCLVVACVAGFMLAVRPSNIIFLLASLVEIIQILIAKFKSKPLKPNSAVLGNMAKAGGVLLLFIFCYSPQHFSMKTIIAGGGIMPVLGSSEGFPYSWNHPDVINLLFHPQGLLTVTPVVIFAMFGLIYFIRSRISEGLAMSLPLIGYVYSISCFNYLYGRVDWAGFGSRYFSECAFIFAVGLAALFELILIPFVQRARLPSRFRSFLTDDILIGFILLICACRMPYNRFLRHGLDGFLNFLFGIYPLYMKELNHYLFESLYRYTLQLWIAHAIILILVMMMLSIIFYLMDHIDGMKRVLFNHQLKLAGIFVSLVLCCNIFFFYSDSHAEIVLGVKRVTDGYFELTKENPVKKVILENGVRTQKLKIISDTANSYSLPQNSVIGNILVTFADGHAITKDVRIGVDVAEWSIHRPDTKAVAGHRDDQIPYLIKEYDRTSEGKEMKLYPIKRYWITVEFSEVHKVKDITFQLTQPKINWDIFNVVALKSGLSNL